MSKEKKPWKTCRKSGELLLETTLKDEKSLSPWKQNRKTGGTAQDFCTLLQRCGKSLSMCSEDCSKQKCYLGKRAAVSWLMSHATKKWFRHCGPGVTKRKTSLHTKQLIWFTEAAREAASVTSVLTLTFCVNIFIISFLLWFFQVCSSSLTVLMWSGGLWFKTSSLTQNSWHSSS